MRCNLGITEHLNHLINVFADANDIVTYDRISQGRNRTDDIDDLLNFLRCFKEFKKSCRCSLYLL